MRKPILYLSLALVLSLSLGLTSTVRAGGDTVSLDGSDKTSDTLSFEEQMDIEGEGGSTSETINLNDESANVDESGVAMSSEIISNDLLVEGNVVADGVVEASSGDFSNNLLANELTISNQANLSGETKISGILSLPFSQMTVPTSATTYLNMDASRQIITCYVDSMYDVECSVWMPTMASENAHGQTLSLTCKKGPYAVLNTNCKLYPSLGGAILAPGNTAVTNTTVTLENGETAKFYAIPAFPGSGTIGTIWVLESKTES